MRRGIMHGYGALIMMFTVASASVFARGFFIGGGAAAAAAFSQHGEFPVGVQGSLQYGASFGLSLGGGVAPSIDLYLSALRFISLRTSLPVHLIIFGERSTAVLCGVRCDILFYPFAFGNAARNDADVR